MWWGFWGRDEEEEEEGRLRGGSDNEGEGDRGRLKRKGLVGLEDGVVLEGSSGAETMVMEFWLVDMAY